MSEWCIHWSVKRTISSARLPLDPQFHFKSEELDIRKAWYFSDMDLVRRLLRGALGFGVVSTLVFSTVAFAERWMYQNLTVPGAYVVWTVLFLVASPVAFMPLIPMTATRRMFPVWFNMAFLAYCALWCAGWFLSPNTLGEVVGCIAGSIALAGVLVACRYVQSLPVAGVVLAICNVLGYFAGGYLNAKLGGPAGMLSWGLLFGAGTGAGIGAILTFKPKEAQTNA